MSDSDKKEKMVDKKLYLMVGIPLLVLVIPVFVFSFWTFSLSSSELVSDSGNSNTEGIRYDGVVCVYKTDGITGEKTDLGCNHNNITFTGINLTRNFLTSLGTTSSGGNFTTIAICNATGGGCSATANQGAAGQGWNNGSGSQKDEYDVNGLSRQIGTFTILPNNNGNVSIFTTFTSSGIAGLEVNSSALFNQTAIASGWNGTMFAVDRFNQVTLDGTAGDQLTVNWTIMVS